MSTRTARVLLKPAVFVASLSPLVVEAWAAFHHQLGPEPYRAVMRDTGAWSLWWLGFTLALTPLRRLTSWNGLALFRRMLGLFAFFYGAIHTLAYVVFDRFAGLDLSGGVFSVPTLAALTLSTVRDISGKPFLAIGLVAFVAMAPLAATSTPGMIRRVGGRRWRQLHRVIYVVAIVSLLHHWWPLADRFHIVDKFALLIVPALVFRVAWAWRRGES